MAQARLARCPWSSLLVSLLAVGAPACSGGSSNSPDAGTCTGSGCPDAGPYDGCTVTFSGDFSETVLVPNSCSVVMPNPEAAADAGADWVLQLTAVSTVLQAPLTVVFDLGPTPSPGSFNTDTVNSWSAVAVSPVGDAGAACSFFAGTVAASEGSFTATVTSISDLSSGEGTAHGTLQAQIYVEPTPGTVCGTSNLEQVSFTF